MIVEKKYFYSDNYKLNGNLYLPGKQRYKELNNALLIFCSGFTGICSLHPARFARYFTEIGYPCFGFDYRGFQESEGPKFRVKLDEQTEDLKAAVVYIKEQEIAKNRKIILAGWAMSAGLILKASFENQTVDGLIALNGFYSGKRFLKSRLGDTGLIKYKNQAAEWIKKYVTEGIEEYVDPFIMYPLDPDTAGFVNNSLKKYSGYIAEQYSTIFAASLLSWIPEIYAPYLDIPILIVHGDQNKLHSVNEPEYLENKYKGESKVLWLKGAGHTEWMFDNNPVFKKLCNDLKIWIENL